MPKLDVNGTHLYYQVTGKGQPLLLIHGLGASARDWEPQVAYFAPRYQVVTPDVRGHGQSDKPPGPYSVPLFASDTGALISGLGIGPAHVVGISMGGMIAFQLAVDSPELVRSLVIVNSGPALLVKSLAAHWQIQKRQLAVRAFGMGRLAQMLAPRLFPEPEQEALRIRFVQHWTENDPRAYRAATSALVNWSVADRLGEIRCPVLVIASDEDYTPVSAKEAYVALMPHAELAVIDDARHAVTVERPEEFNAVLEAFLSRLS
jgi:pimeloyl-ACP methyl ester carboxylesterase